MKTASKLTVFGDGGSRGNPGQAAYGFVILDEKGSVLYQEGKRIGIASNNVAEYSSVINALKYIKAKIDTAEEINFFLDSLLVASQMNGKFKIKHPDMKRLYFEAKELERELNANIFYAQVPRAQNKLADKLVNDALDDLI